MSNPFQLTFTLKQHTPIIHFQHEQAGATLRATEVKPKLDKFIMERVLSRLNKSPERSNDVNFSGVASAFRKKADENIGMKHWLQGEHNALNYKINITANEASLDDNVSGLIEYWYRDRRGKEMPEKFPCFFGLMGGENKDSKKFSFYKEVNVEIKCLNRDLKKEIESSIPSFFMKNNFGNRQSKGFGAFFPEDQNRFTIIPLKYYFDVDVSKPSRSSYEYIDREPTPEFRTYYRLFEIINLFYSTLRSGINQGWGGNPIYFKSMMFMYSKNRLEVQWDKKRIKEMLFADKLTEHKRRYPNSDIVNYNAPKSFLMRDLLGLASESKWFAEYNDTITITSNGFSSDDKERAKDKIDRFKSPIVFKPIEKSPGKFRIYFEADESGLHQGMLSHSFEIAARQGRQKPFNISTPPTFVVDDFLRYAFSIDVAKHIQSKSGSGYSADKELLIDVYKQIRTNAGIAINSP